MSSQRRFAGIEKLYGESGFARIQAAQVCIVGVGGVGSWAAEALTRSGVGHLRLIDLDHVAESNINRQLHALDSTLGQAKVLALKARITEINPECVVETVEEFVCAETPLAHISDATDFVIDCIDHALTKAALIAACKSAKLPIITCGGAGGKLDPTRIKVLDLSRTRQDSLLAKTRKTLRQRHFFSHNPKRRFGIPAVYSDEVAKELPANDLNCDAPLAHQKPAEGGLNCAGYGSITHVTATFGLVAAGRVLERLAKATDHEPHLQEMPTRR